MRVGFLTSWNERCGIAEYSARLVAELRRHAEVDVVPATFLRSPRAVYAAMGTAVSGGDVAHVQHSYAFFGGLHPLRSGWAALAGSVRRPLVVTVHELDFRATGAFGMPAPVERAYKRWFNGRVFLHPAVGRWMVHAEALRDALVELGAPPEWVTYLPLPVEIPEAVPDARPIREKLRLAGLRPLTILGFLSRRKGYSVALQALTELPPEFVLVAAGGEHAADRTGTTDWLRAEARRVGGDALERRLRVTGYLSEAELDQVTAASELILAPFLEMSASASLNYALARGKAVLASDLPEIRRLGCVRLVPAGDPSALAAAVRELAASPSLRLKLGEDALRYARAHGYEALARETLRVYRSLLDRS